MVFDNNLIIIVTRYLKIEDATCSILIDKLIIFILDFVMVIFSIKRNLKNISEFCNVFFYKFNMIIYDVPKDYWSDMLKIKFLGKISPNEST
jgi:hypothetical protein